MSKTDFNELFYRPPTFCDECGELLNFEIFTGDKVKCKVWVNKVKNREDKLRAEQKVKRSIINEKCPKCGYGQMYYSVMQTRSADEGSTVFYECIKCHYKYNQNN